MENKVPTYYQDQIKRQHDIIIRSTLRINQLCACLDMAESQDRVLELRAKILAQAKLNIAAQEKADLFAQKR